MTDDSAIALSGQVGQEHAFSTITTDRGEILTFELKPTFTSLGLPAAAFKSEFQGRPGAKTFRAAITGGTTVPGVVWFFMGEDYVGYDLRKQELTGPATISADWGASHWPPTYGGVDAAVSFTNQPGFVWFFKGSTYIRYNLVSDVVEGPEPILGNWHGFPDAFAAGFDAAVQGRGDFEGMGWFFKGLDYFRFNNLINQVDLGPRPITAGWRGWPEEFTAVDCAVPGIGSESELIYFFSGDKCFPYDLAQDAAAGPIRQISEAFPLLAPFMKRPQLFLVETLSLSTYFGDTSTGEPQEGTRSLDPGETATYTVIVSRSESTTTVENTTVLESRDDALVDDLNSTMKNESSQSKSKDSYDYKFDSSFNGDLSYSGLGGSVDANLNFQGSSNDVRDAAASSAGSAVQKQVSRASAHRQQTMRFESGTDAHDAKTESAFTKSVTNPLEVALNLGAFQLIQEYLAFLVLTDIKVGFSNGGQPEVFPLTGLDVGLAKFCADATQAAFIKQAIIRELSGLLDYQNTPTKVISDVGDGRIAFAKALESQWQLKNSDGSVRRTIVVPGLLISPKSYKVLTRALILKELAFL